MKPERLNPFELFRDQWAVMGFYERFEQVVALILSAVIAVIIVVSLIQLISIVSVLLVINAFNPLDHKVFQSVFVVILDPDVSPGKVAALAGATLALGATYWLLRERDDRVTEEAPGERS